MATRGGRRRWPAPIAGVVVGLAALAGVAWGQEPATLALLPASQVVAAAQPEVSVSVDVHDASNLGAFEFRISFDANVLTYKAVKPSGFLSSTGRSATCPSAALAEGSVQWGCATSGFPLSGPSGSGTLGTVVFTPKAPGVSPLVFTKIELADASDDAKPIAVGESATGVIKVTGPDGGGGGSSDNHLEPTPTSNPTLLTPTAIANLPTPDNEYTLADPATSPGELGTPVASGQGSAGSIGGGRSGSQDGTSSASQGAPGVTGSAAVDQRAGRFPISGFGMARDATARLAVWARILLLAGVVVLTAGLVVRDRRIR